MANEYPKNKIELPTVGRIVHLKGFPGAHTLAAIVACVPDEDRPLIVHLGVFNADGTSGNIKNVRHMSEAAEHGEVYWDWMPYQKSQAAKTEQLQRELDIQNDPVKRTADMLARHEP